jgi:hypothetical protein
MTSEPYKDKYCNDCKLYKPLNEFNFASGGQYLNSYCKLCTAIRSKKYYHKNKGFGKLHFERRRDEQQKLMAEFFSNNPCSDCGILDIRVLEFDHLKDKKENISIMMRGHSNWNNILEEMKKCEVVCRNCHAIRTAERQKNWRYRFYKKEVGHGY